MLSRSGDKSSPVIQDKILATCNYNTYLCISSFFEFKGKNTAFSFNKKKQFIKMSFVFFGNTLFLTDGLPQMNKLGEQDGCIPT